MTDPTAAERDKVTISVDQDGCYGNKGYQVNLGKVDAQGNGHGYRLLGPKYGGCDKQRNLATAVLDERDAREIFSYIRPLLGDDWLAARVTDSGATPCA
jgi:hypothetical protein